MGSHPVAVVQYTYTHKQYRERQRTNNTYKYTKTIQDCAQIHVYQLDKEKNQCIREKTGAENIVKETKQYQEKWLQHIQRMDTKSIPEQALQYKPKGRRHIGRPRKRWRGKFHFEDTRNRNQT